jgi:pyruvate/2-oxoglutarate dehydrogenase complex dihydrolipoamide dehydrogenase (E3) component
LVEGDTVGGTRLNIGRIPSKALTQPHAYHQAHHYMGLATLGIHVMHRIDVAQTKDGKTASSPADRRRRCFC